MAPEPDKYMKITLREKGESYYISAIQATDPPETAATKRSRLKRREKRSARLLPALKGLPLLRRQPLLPHRVLPGKGW